MEAVYITVYTCIHDHFKVQSTIKINSPESSFNRIANTPSEVVSNPAGLTWVGLEISHLTSKVAWVHLNDMICLEPSARIRSQFLLARSQKA